MKSKHLFTILFLTGVVFFCWGSFISEDEKISKTENRRLQTMNSSELSVKDFIDGFYNGYFERYIDDQLIFRDELISMVNSLNFQYFNVKEFGNIIIGKEDYIFHKSTFANDQCDMNRMKQIEKQLEWLNEYAKTHNVSLLMIPDQITFAAKYLPDYYEFYEPIEYDTISESLDVFPNIHKIDLQNYFEHQEEPTSYFYFGNPHWNMKGTQMGVHQLMTSMGIEYQEVPLSEVQIDIMNRDAVNEHIANRYHYSPRTLYNQIPFEYETHRDQLIYEVESTEEQQGWQWIPQDEANDFLFEYYPKLSYGDVGNGKIAVSINKNKELPTLLIYHDSFGQSMPIFMNRYFSKVIYIGSFTLEQEMIEKMNPDYIVIESVPNSLYARIPRLMKIER